MSKPEHPRTAEAAGEDVAAIAALHSAISPHRAAFAADRYPTIDARRDRLGALVGMMLSNRNRISAAIAEDFGAHPAPASELLEVLGVVGRAQYVLEKLEGWMTPEPRAIDPAMFGSARAKMHYQPKGVIGNIVPWNFPIELAIGPMTEMLAAGNRVIVKPSDQAPACAELLREMIAATFDPDLVTVAVGGIALARAFPTLPWDHLLYTGSPGIGRQVMAAAALNLTPVTLELGGKCPAVLTPGSVTAANVESVIGTKIIKNGQMCVSVDHCFVPRGEVERFVEEARAFLGRAAPAYSRSDECAGIISTGHLARLRDMVDNARARGVRIVELEEAGEIDPVTRRMPMVLAIDPPGDLRLMQEEIFGPILPVIPYDDLDAVLHRINAAERPLGLYVFGDDAALVAHVLAATTSGGASINTCAVQSALPSLGFGGSGMSGMGRHHGIEGFREFSNQRGVVRRGEGDLIDTFYAPYAKASGLIEAVLGPGAAELP